MSEKNQDVADSTSKISKKKGFAILGLCVLACKLPLLIAFLGFGGFAATASLLDQSLGLTQIVMIGIAIAGFLILTVYFIRKIYRRTQT